MAVLHKTYTCILINIRLLLVSMLMLNPSISLAEGTPFDIEEVFLDVFINDQRKDTVLLLRNEGRLFATRVVCSRGLKIFNFGACVCLILTL